MSLERFFVCPRALQRLRCDPLGCQLDGFCEWLEAGGFSRRSVRRHLSNVGHLNAYLAERGLKAGEPLCAELLDGFFEAYRSRCRDLGLREGHVRRAKYSANRFRGYLKSVGLFDSREVGKPYDALLSGYLVWMRDHGHAASRTLELRGPSVRHFLEWLGEEATPAGLSMLTAEKVEEFFLAYAEGNGRFARRSMPAALRTFLRFALYEGLISRPLDGAVPSLRTYRGASVPREISDEHAVRVLETVPRDTPVGRRDFAILQMLYAYGVRGGQVRALCLEDIEWERDQILFRALKRGKDSLLPLTQSVGVALLEYLQKGRPKTAHREVFLTSRAPYHPLRHSHTLSAIVERRIRAAGLELASSGAHAFRHGFASRKQREGHSLKEIADVLGHRYLGTTFQYTKVDASVLEQVGLEWPGEAES